MNVIIVLGLASIIFLTAILIGFALMMRGQWDRLPSGQPPAASPPASSSPSSSAPRRPRAGPPMQG